MPVIRLGNSTSAMQVKNSVGIEVCLDTDRDGATTHLLFDEWKSACQEMSVPTSHREWQGKARSKMSKKRMPWGLPSGGTENWTT